MGRYTDDWFPNAIFGTMDDGSIVALNFYIEPITEFLAAAVYVKWCWGGQLDDGFDYAGGWSVASSDAQAVEDIMRSGNHWDSSWENIKNGTVSYVSPRDGQSYAGGLGVSRRFQDWLINNNVYNIELATDQQWMPTFMAQIQAELDARLVGLAKPPKPVPPQPPWTMWHPTQVGQITSALTTDLAQASRLTLTSVNGRMTLGKIPIPH